MLESARAFLDRGQLQAAIEACERALRIAATDAAALRLLGEASARNGDTRRAYALWEQVLASSPNDAEAFFHLGSLARVHGNHDQAIEYLRLADRLAPRHPAISTNLGLALEAVGNLEDAEHAFRTASTSAPTGFAPLANLAQNLYQQRRFDDALEYFNVLVTRFEVSDAAIWANRAVCAVQTGDLDTAEASYRAALDVDSTLPQLHSDLGFLELERKRYSQAASLFEEALRLAPDDTPAASSLLYCRMQLAQWDDFDVLRNRVIAKPAFADQPGGPAPIAFAAISDDPAAQRLVAERWAKTKVSAAPPAYQRQVKLPDVPHRLGFVSAGLCDHPVGRLVVDLIERLPGRRFDVVLYSVAAARGDDIERRLIGAADYQRVSTWNCRRIADRVRSDGIDVLFDLDGLSGRSLVELFAMRPAPLQVNFLGYTGTLGTDVYDFIISDRHCIPDEFRRYYVERPLYVDPCYLPSDSRRTVESTHVTRSQYGLPEDAAVLCAFANTYKILPELFDAWMRILVHHDDAVLWLRDVDERTKERFRQAAEVRGVRPTRLFFAPTEHLGRYLARFRLASLFLDTAPFGAHTTVNDALFAGLPVVTMNGRSFAGRASASQVIAAGLPSLVANDVRGYCDNVDRLLANPSELTRLGLALKTPATSSHLFDMDRYADRFGEAIRSAWRMRIEQGPPDR